MRAEIHVGGDVEQRREARHVARRDGAVGAEGADGLPATVTDLSPSGCRLVVDAPLETDSVIWLKVGDEGPFMARVVWYDGTAAGCEFAGRLHPDMVAQLSDC